MLTGQTASNTGDSIPTHFEKLDKKDDLYEFCSANVNDDHGIVFGEPCNVNINSYANVSKTLDKIMDDAGIRRPGSDLENQCKREWGIVVCDGAPYSHATKLQDTVFVCPNCFTKLHKTHVNAHIPTCNGSMRKIMFERAFASLIIVPGLGHIELNILKCFVFLNHINSATQHPTMQSNN